MSGGVRLGETFAGYRVESIIGRGGMSVVYLAEDLRLGRKVTLKILAPELAADPTFQKRFVNESRIAAGLDHPNVVPIYEADEADGRLFIAMRYVRGTDLDVLIRDEGALPLRRTAEIVRQVAAALDTAHREGLVHRDVKPANILITPGSGTEGDHAYLTDFGITKRRAQGPITTRTGEIMGTVDYVAPEQVEGRSVDFRADVYSLGCVAYQAITGHVPYERESDLAVLWAHVHEKPPKASARSPELWSGVDVVLARAMAKEPKDRFESCGAFAAALQDRVEPTVRPQWRAPSVRPTRHRTRAARRWSVLIAIPLTLAIVGIVAGSLSGGSPSQACPSFSHSRMTLKRIDPGSMVPGPPVAAPPSARAIAVGQEGVWVATTSGISVACVAPGQAGGSVALDFTASRLAPGIDGVWVAGAGKRDGGSSSDGGVIARIVHPNGRVDRSLPLPAPPRSVTLGPEAVWVLGSDGTLTRLAKPVGLSGGSATKATNRSVGAGATDVVWDDSEPSGPVVWVANGRTRTIRPVRPHPFAAGSPTPVPGRADAIAVTPREVWILDEERRVVTPIDVPTRKPARRPIPVGRLPTDIVAADYFVWVANGWSVSRIDPATGEVQQQPMGGRVLSLAVSLSVPPRQQAIWVLVRGPAA
jgi:serine/threonine protein kinase